MFAVAPSGLSGLPCCAVSFRGTLNLSFVFSEPALSRADTEAIADRVVELLERAMTDGAPL